MLSSMQQPKLKSRRVSSFRDFPEGFDLIPKPNPDDLQDIFHLTKDDVFAAYPLIPNQDSDFPSDALATVQVEEAESFVGKMDLNSNDVDDVSKPLSKARRLSADRDFPRFCGRGTVDENGGDMVIADIQMCSSKEAIVRSKSEKRLVVVGLMAASMCSSKEKNNKKKKKKKNCLVQSPRAVVKSIVDEDGDIFQSHSDIPGGSHVEMCSSKGKKRNLLQAIVRSNEMDCAQGKQEMSEPEKGVIVIGLMAVVESNTMDCPQEKQASQSMSSSKEKKKKKSLQAIVESNTMDCPQEKQASESEERVSVIGLMAASEAQENSKVLPKENLEDEFRKSYPFWS